MGKKTGTFKVTSEKEIAVDVADNGMSSYETKDSEQDVRPDSNRETDSMASEQSQKVEVGGKENGDHVSGNPKAEPSNGDIEMKIILNGHTQGSSSTSKTMSETPNTARKRKKNFLNVDDMSMADVISLSGVDTMCTISNYDASSVKDMEGDEGEQEEEEEKGIRMHHVLAVILGMASISTILLLYFLVPCPCEPQDWSIQLTSVVSKSPVRLQDVNQDGMDDLIFGFGFGIEYESIEDMDQYCHDMNLTAPCGGGVMAMSGWRGDVLWEVRTNQTISSLMCGQLDVNQDGQKDCLAAGLDGQILAIDSRSGVILWDADPAVTIPTWSYYQPQVLGEDLDEDAVPDLVVTHGQEISDEQTNTTEAGRLILLSGKTGQSLGTFLEMPDGMTTRCPPVIYQASDDDATTPYIVFGSGTATTQGSMWMMRLDQVFCQITGGDCATGTLSPEYRPITGSISGHMTSQEMPVIELVRGTGIGYELPAIVADMTLDGVNDLIITSADARVTVINGTSMEPLWHVDRYSDSYRVLSLPAPGRFDDDDIPDIVVHLSALAPSDNSQDQIVILNGSNGEELWHTVSMSSDLSPLTPDPLSLRADDYKDAFIFWLASQDSGDTATTTQASGEDQCSDLGASLSTLNLVMMDRDMAFSPAVLMSTSSYVYYGNSSDDFPPGHMTTNEPMTTLSSDHVTSSISTEASHTTVLDITTVLERQTNTKYTPSSNLLSTSSSLSSQSTGGLRRRREAHLITGAGCYQMDPRVTSTGVIGDFDDNGSLEILVMINVMSSSYQDGSTPSPSISPQLTVQRFGLEEALDLTLRTNLAEAETYLSPHMDNSTFSGNLFNHFDILETKLQSWFGYMGTEGNGRYS